jgi:hypothetical protein
MSKHLQAKPGQARRNGASTVIAIFIATVAAQGMACGSVKSTNRPLLQQPESTAKPVQAPAAAK